MNFFFAVALLASIASLQAAPVPVDDTSTFFDDETKDELRIEDAPAVEPDYAPDMLESDEELPKEILDDEDELVEKPEDNIEYGPAADELAKYAEQDYAQDMLESENDLPEEYLEEQQEFPEIPEEKSQADAADAVETKDELEKYGEPDYAQDMLESEYLEEQQEFPEIPEEKSQADAADGMEDAPTTDELAKYAEQDYAKDMLESEDDLPEEYLDEQQEFPEIPEEKSQADAADGEAETVMNGLTAFNDQMWMDDEDQPTKSEDFTGAEDYSEVEVPSDDDLKNEDEAEEEEPIYLSEDEAEEAGELLMSELPDYEEDEEVEDEFPMEKDEEAVEQMEKEMEMSKKLPVSDEDIIEEDDGEEKDVEKEE